MIAVADLTNDHSIGQAKDALRAVLLKGEHCPVCQQFAKMYTRTITSAAAYNLYLFVRYFEVGQEFHMARFLSKFERHAGDTPKLCYWQLLERVEGKTEDGNPNNGYYKLTKAGQDFVRNPTIEVPKYIKLYNDEDYGFLPDEYINIKDCFGNKFNYNELMKR